MRKLFLVATALLLASVGVTNRAAGGEEYPVSDVSLVTVMEDGICIFLSIDLGVAQESSTKLMEPYVEFTISEPPSDQNTEFTAFAVMSSTARTVELAKLTQVALVSGAPGPQNCGACLTKARKWCASTTSFRRSRSR